MLTRFVAGILALCVVVAAARAEDWPAWRGPRLDGTSTEKHLPLRWSGSDNVAWKVEIPGVGHSSPIIFGDRVFVTSCLENDQKRMLYCLDRISGKILWDREVVAAKLERKHKLNSFSSSTPATDGKYVWVAFLDYPNMVAVCYDYDGKEIWRKSPGTLLSVHGFCSSPVLYKDLVILNGDQDAPKDGQAYIVALDKKTGEEKWRADRPNKTRSYCTPILIESKGKPGVTQLVLSGSKCVTSYNADTGKLLWIIDGPTEQYVASLVFLDETLFLTTGFPEYHLMGIKPDGEGNITNSKQIAWHLGAPKKLSPKEASYVPSPIAYDGHFFVVSDLGYLTCLEAQTGKRLWMEQMGRHHSASPVLADGHFYFADDSGVMWVLKAGNKFEVVAKNELGEECYASPAISQGQIFIRGLNHLYCIGKPAKASAP
jgi:outer membrane protein assembly factor BamB